MAKIFAGTVKNVTERELRNQLKARRIAAEGMVVLENNGILPLKGVCEVALLGSGARQTIKGGTGSGDVNTREVVNVEQALSEAGFTLYGETWRDRLSALVQQEKMAYFGRLGQKLQTEGMGAIMDYFNNPFHEPTSVPIEEADLGLCDLAVFVVSRNSGEGKDRTPDKGDYYLSDEETANLDKITASYAHTIVVLNVGGVIDTSYFRSNPKIDAVLLMSQAGNMGGYALADVLLGASIPSGHLTTTWAKDYYDYPSARTFSHVNGDTDDEYYTDGIYVGYRYFDTFGVEPAYEFGYGKGYTKFEVSPVAVEADEKQVTVKAIAENVGSFPGKEAVQVYVSAPAGDVEKPYQELKGYAKTALLQPGQAEAVEITFATKDMASFNTDKAAYVLDAGKYIIRVGNSSRNTAVAAVIELDESATTLKIKNLLAPDEPVEEISNADATPITYEGEAEEIAAAPVIKISAADITCEEIEYSPVPAALPEIKTEEPITMSDVAAGKYTVEDLVSQLTIEEMADMCVGTSRGSMGSAGVVGNQSAAVPGAAGDTSSILLESRGVRNLVLADGPAGLRLSTEFAVDGQNNLIPGTSGSPLAGLEILGIGTEKPQLPDDAVCHYQYCTAIPIATLLAQTWDVDLIEEAGELVGEEMDEFGVDLWLAPGMNIHRNPLCGRNFEYYSEDPLVSGKSAAADTRGVQSHRGGTTIKHYAFNNQEDNRSYVNSHVSERAAREIYLKGFEIAVKEAQPKSIMTSYNLENGVHSATNKDLLQYFARDEWGFEGVVMTDWGTTGSMLAGDGPAHKYPDSDPAECIIAGNDLIMPGSQRDIDVIVKAVEEGRLTKGELQACVIRIIKAVINCD